jgi:hypothetical protein
MANFKKPARKARAARGRPFQMRAVAFGAVLFIGHHLPYGLAVRSNE